MFDKKRVQFSVTIKAPVDTVYKKMIDAESYRDWSSAFAEGSQYQGSWQKGQRIRFMGPDGCSMLSEIAENREAEFISIRHLGMITKDGEDTESDAAKAWAYSYENYTFQPVAEGTKLVVDQDVTADFEIYLQDTWPKALARLKVICEVA